MSEMIERVARAICECHLWPGAFNEETEGNQEAWRQQAHAAIEAMREPTETMLVAGHDAWAYVGSTQLHSWRAMIDQALGRSETPARQEPTD